MNYNNPISKKTVGVVRYSCGILFTAFSFCYLYFFGGEVLAEAQYVYSHGVTHYSIGVGAVIIASVLQLFQWIVAKVSRLPDRFYSLTYMPSAMFLTMVTAFDERSISHFSLGAWAWWAPLLVVLYVFLVMWIRSFESVQTDRNSSYGIVSVLWPNYAILCLMLLLSGMLHGAKDTYMFELKTERLIKSGQYEKALEVGANSLQTTQRLTFLRMYALSLMDSLPDKMMDYPQEYGAHGLLVVSDSNRLLHRVDVRDVCHSLGALSGSSVKSTDRYLKLLMAYQQQRADSLASVDSTLYASADSTLAEHEGNVRMNHIRQLRTYDYYLCKLLLEKKLHQFVNALNRYYQLRGLNPDSLVKPLPRAYEEALCMLHPERVGVSTYTRFVAFQQMEDSIANPLIRSNLTRRKYGNTYWWYFKYQH